jgi:signal transduction histidine kinase
MEGTIAADMRELRGPQAMPEPEIMVERGFRAEPRKQLNSALHDLCQPLTTLQCRLEMAILSDSVEGYREAAETGLTECRRIVQLVESMRAILQETAKNRIRRVRGVEKI